MCADSTDWDTAADDWSRQLNAGFDRVREEYNWPAFVDLLGPLDGRDVIDLGCGNGAMTRRLATHASRVTGLDTSRKMIVSAQRENAAPNIRYDVVCADAPFALQQRESADLIVGFMLLMSTRRLEPVAFGAERALRPGGRLCLALLHPCFSHGGMEWAKCDGAHAINLFRYSSRSDVPGVVRFQTAREAGRAGFSVKRQERTLEDTLRPFLSAGLRLSALHEPVPSAEAVAQNGHLRRWRNVAPAFLHLVFEK
ncbi:hypothetical protein RA29_17900 [Tateyamaria sp. ANG-S1]|nr:class I SAM-dependent methyltransferase [Tateyamaria sp. ANG-S1]KIC48065.1 hypothetical protein RA29_17900 [Tateyamaria sp. ANG-S1]